MTEAEWMSASEPSAMLEAIRGKASGRKLRLRNTERRLRLFAVACCRRIWHLVTDERCRVAVELAERSADESVDPVALNLASAEAEEAYEESLGEWTEGVFPVEKSLPCEAASYASNSPVVRVEDAVTVATAASACFKQQADEESAQSALLRDIFGNPFRPVTFDPRWRSETAVSLASAIYEERAFDRLPILADALEEAGCDHADVLAHCRGPGPHVRGCWVVDLVLDRV
jgi:hypothetical protein